MNKLSTFLFARPSFIEGIARLIDFGNTLQEYNSPPASAQVDDLALAADWKVLGDDLMYVLKHKGPEELPVQREEIIKAEIVARAKEWLDYAQSVSVK